MRLGRGLVCFVCFLSATASPPAASGAVSGQVRTESVPHQPIAGARVTLFEPSLLFFRETRTDSLGQYAIEDVPPGTYQIGAGALRFEYNEATITVGDQGFNHSFELGPETEVGSWEIVGNTLPEFLDATDIGTLLPNGRIFYCHDTTDPIVFDPVTGAKSYPGSSERESGCMNASLLADGRVIMVGGQDGSDPGSFTNAVRWVRTYTPLSDTWQFLDDLQHAVGRWYPGLARLADGSFLTMGGGTCCSAVRTDTCERFDLAAETWSYTGSMVNPCEFPPAALLFTGEVLATWWPPQLYNPSTGQWRPTGNFNQPNRGWPGHSDHSIAVLEDGRVLAIGVLKGLDDNSVMGEIYDPGTETWSLTSNPEMVRFQTEVVQLPDGRILVAGGETEEEQPEVPNELGIVKWCDLYDPETNAWRRVADMNWFREYHAVTLLVPDGRVLTTGGTRIKFQVGPTSADIEAYIPPYLRRGVRPQITAISSTELTRGCPVTATVSPTTQITSVVLMGTQTTTHWVDAGIPRRLVLSVEQTGNDVTTTLPLDPNILPLGHYMLFAMVDDIPSIAIIVQVVAANALLYGDVDGSGVVDIDDILCLLNGFADLSTCPQGDIFPCGGGNGVIDIDDILAVLAAFAGQAECSVTCQ